MMALGWRMLVSIATVGPCGHTPVAPGTVGSAAGVAIFLAVADNTMRYLFAPTGQPFTWAEDSTAGGTPREGVLSAEQIEFFKAEVTVPTPRGPPRR